MHVDALINKIISIFAVWFLLAQPVRAIIGVSFQMQLGNPSGATADTNNHTHYLIQRTIEAMDYNDTTGQPNWASWDLTSADANGAVPRQDSFAADTNLPAGFFKVGATNYAYSGYDRGHLCDSADRTDSTNDNDLTFLMSNMMPQAPDNNEVTWAGFEGYCRGLADAGNEVLITCGPVGFTGAKINTNGYVSIPTATWKIVVIVPVGAGSVTNRITATNRVIAIKVPNTNGILSAWQNYITSAGKIEADTGYTFFTTLPPGVAAVLRAKVDGATNLPPLIYAFSPTNGAAGTNVVITGTNFNAVTAVAFSGTSANYTINSSNQLTAVVPTNATSGFISITTPSGTATSTNTFTVAGNLGSVFSGVIAGWDATGLTDFGPPSLAPTVTTANLFVGGLTRSSGIKTNNNGAAGGWGGIGFTSATSAAAIATNQFITFSLTVSNGYKAAFTSLSRFDYRRPATGASSGILQVQIGTGAYTDITNLNYSSTNNSGASIGAINLTNMTALQNIGANTNVTFRLVNFGGSGSSGSWYVYNFLGTTAPDLALTGTITEIILTTNVPSIQGINFVGGQISLVVTGAVATSYTVTATTNLTAPNWVTLLTTNPAAMPFTFVDTNRFAQRFYRVSSP